MAKSKTKAKAEDIVKGNFNLGALRKRKVLPVRL